MTVMKPDYFGKTRSIQWLVILRSITLSARRQLNSFQWRHNGRDGVSNNQPHHWLLSHLFRRRSKKTSKLRITGLCAGNSPGPVNSPHKWPITRKMFPFNDVIMYWLCKGRISFFSMQQGFIYLRHLWQINSIFAQSNSAFRGLTFVIKLGTPIAFAHQQFSVSFIAI